MKVKTWIRRIIYVAYIEDEKAKNILMKNGIYDFSTYKEQILDIDLNDIVDDCKKGIVHEAGYRYCNRLYDLVHKKSIFILEKDDLEYEIIEDGYPEDIPYAYCEFDDVEQFHNWMLEEGIKEKFNEIET